MKDYEEAIEYLKEKSATFRELYEKIENSGITIIVKFNDNLDNGTFDPRTKTVTWDRDAGLKVGSKAITSPAITLAHEFGHAAQLIDGQYFNMDRNSRENADVKQWEKIIAKEC